MKSLFALMIAGLSLNSLAQNLSAVPFYFAVPESAHLPLQDTSWKKIPVKGIETNNAYLRGYHFADGSVAGRRAAFKQLLQKEVIKTGDIVLSFRPTWEKTIPYAHVQMGVSHAGMAYVENGVVRNLDMPLDADYNGQNLTGGFDSKHYLETPHLQVIRPRNLTPEKLKNLEGWIRELKKNYASIRAKGLLKFNSDYSAPKIDRYSKDDAFVTTLARILSGKDTSSTNLTMFCSEYVWALLSLSNCAPNDAEITNASVADASCVTPVFEAMYMTSEGSVPGLTEGPLAVINALGISPAIQQALMSDMFTTGQMSGLSAGHRALAGNPQVAVLIEALKMLYPAKLAHKDAEAMGISFQINSTGGRNYSPTAFLINSMLETDDAERKLDYVATIMFGN